MAITIDGTAGTIAGVAVGGLPDGIVDGDMLAANAVSTGKILNATIASGDIASGVIPAGGKVLQVVSAFSGSGTTVGSSYVDIAGTNISITPSLATSRIFLTWSTGGHVFDRSGVNAIAIKGVSSEDGTVFEMWRYAYCNHSGSFHVPLPLAVTHIDSPNSTSSITYKLQGKCSVSSGFGINPDGGTNQVRVIAMEIGS